MKDDRKLIQIIVADIFVQLGSKLTDGFMFH